MKASNFKIFFLMLFLLFSLRGISQISEVKTKELENKSFKAYLNKDYKTALKCLYELDNEVSYKSHIYDYWIGICLLSTENKLGAIPYLEHAERSKSTSFVVNYYLGRAYMFASRYSEAKLFLNKYSNSLKEKGIKFKEENVLNDEHKIHVAKTSQEVDRLLTECELFLNDKALTSR